MQQLENLINDISDKTIRDFIRSKNSAFKEITKDYSCKLTDNRFSGLKKLGYIDYDDSDSLLVFSCKYNDDLSSRSSKKMQFEIAKKLLKENFKDGAVFVFYDNAGRFRFSFIRKNYGNKEQKFTPWKRYTYFVDKTQTNKTFKDCIGNASFSSLEKIQEGFSLEPLSIEFFDKYKEIYGKFVGYITGKYYKKKSSKNWEEVDYADHEPDFIQFKKEFNSNHKQVRDYVKKLLGRLVFLKFIEKKGWLGEIKDTKEIEPNFLENVFKNSSYQDDFLDKVLEEVIFESLNNPIGNTNKCEELKKYSFPYLNGGLFEKDELDKQSIHFPKEYFEEIFAFFNQYNFTIDENDPNDAEVSVDPEMLGHIFENLLEDNKDKGAFYTPKEIVHYMCQESLIEYLYTSLSYEKDEEKDLIIELVKTKVINEGLKDNLVEIEEALEKVKICDPAIGSGAFPMGLLQEIFSIKQSIYYNIHNTLDNFPAGKEKLNIIQNNIYGVDIEQGAVDIARLRFWLSLVVDETEAKPLPNLDYKIMCGNSLISRYPLEMPLKNVFDQYNKAKKPEEKLSLRRYKDLVNSYTDTHLGKDVFKAMIEQIKATFKTSLKNKDIIDRQKKEAIVFDYEKLDLLGTRKADIDKAGYKKAKLELQKLIQAEEDVKNNKIYENSFEWRFEFPDLLDEEGNFQGFNIVIGNPPYLKEGRASRTVFDGVRSSQYYQGKMDIWYMFACYGIDLLRSNGILCFIATNNWVTNSGASILRNKVINDTKILQLNDFANFMLFESASIQTMVMMFEKNNKLDNYTIDYRRLKGNTKLSDVVALLSKEKTKEVEYLTPIFNRSSFTNKYFTFSLNETILDKISKNKINLNPDEIAQGIVFPQDFLNKKNQKILGNKFKIGDSVFALNLCDKDSIRLNESEKSLIKPLYNTEQILRYYSNNNNNNWLIYTNSSFKNPRSMDNYPNLKAHLDKFANIITSDNKPYGLHRSRDERFFKGEKVIALRKCIDRPLFSYSDFDCYLSATFYVIKTNRVDMKYLTGLLNSKLIQFWLKNKGKMQGLNYQLDKEPLIAIPIASPEKSKQSLIKNLVNKILEIKNKDINGDITSIELKIDILVYKLYDLTYDEVLVIDPLTPITREEYELEID